MDTTEELAEDATELKFPKEFETAKALLNSEVFILLEARKNQNESIDEVRKYCQNYQSEERLWLCRKSQ